MKTTLLIALLVLAGCRVDAPPPVPPPTPEELARKVCEYAKPGFDRIQAALESGGEFTHEPLNDLPGIEGTFRGTSMSFFTTNDPVTLIETEVKGERAGIWKFDDLDLTCMTFKGKADYKGLTFQGGWIVARVFKSNEGPDLGSEERPYQVWHGLMHISAIGDVRWAETAE